MNIFNKKMSPKKGKADKYIINILKLIIKLNSEKIENITKKLPSLKAKILS